jgi:hypothetical protein
MGRGRVRIRVRIRVRVRIRARIKVRVERRGQNKRPFSVQEFDEFRVVLCLRGG